VCGVSARIMHRVRKVRLGSPFDKLVLIMLASYADDDGGRVFPSMSRLATDCSMSRRGVQKIADRLVASGVVMRIRQGGKGPRSTHEFRINIAALESMVPQDKCEPGSHIDHEEVRTGFAHSGGLSANVVPISANLSADKCEPGSHESSLNRQESSSHAHARAAAATRFAFEGKVIRLNHEDFETWRSAYHGIPDLGGELVSIDAWWNGRHPTDSSARAGWFVPVSGMLNKKHQAALAEKANGGPVAPIGL
jgi:hypothetical protein